MQTRALARARRSVATIVPRSHDDEGVGEALLAWGLLAASGIAVFLTYARVPASQLYHVSGHGTAAGASRVLVFANFPVALVAIPVAAISAARLGRRGAAGAALVSIALSAAVFWPGVVDQADLDARWINALATLGAGVALALALLAGWRHGFGFQPRRSGDDARLVVSALLVFLSVPWIAADAGFHFEGVPVLSSVWQTGELRQQPDQTTLHPAVHLGHHHGLDGALLALCVLALSRLRPRRLAVPVSLYLALLFAYGVGNVANDFWLEQVVKRGWTSWQIPSVLTPAASWAWLALVGGAGLVWIVALRPARPAARGLR